MRLILITVLISYFFCYAQDSDTDNFAIIQDTSSISSKPEKPAPEISKNKENSIQPNKTIMPKNEYNNYQYGTIAVKTGDPGEKVYINGVYVGCGDTVLSGLSPGLYTIHVEKNSTSEEKNIMLYGGTLQNVELTTIRNTYFIVTNSITQFWSRRLRAYGPSLEIGLQKKFLYYAFNFNWAFFNSLDNGHAFMCGGAGLQLYYTGFNYKDYFSFQPGFCTGFWYFDGYKRIDDTSLQYPYEKYYNEYFFGGPSLRLNAGYKYIFFSSSYSLLIGSTAGHLVTIGIRALF